LLAALLATSLPASATFGFLPPETYFHYGDLQWQGNGVLVQDINGDGLDDAVLAYFDWGDSLSNVAIFLQNPGTHALDAPAVHAAVPNDWGGVYIASIESADMNGDGVKDVIVGHTAGVSIFDPAHGFGFLAMIENRTGASADPLVARSGDIDGDGDPDIALLVGNTKSPSLWVYMNDGAGHFDAGNRLPLPGVCCFRDLRVLDINKSGRNDLLLYSSPYSGYSSNSRGYWAYFNQGGGVFPSGPKQIVSDVDAVGGMAEGDLDADGFPDLALWSHPINGGTTPYTVRVYFHTPFPTPYRLPAKTWQMGYGGYDGPMLVGDLNADGKQDLAYVERTSILNNEGTGYLSYLSFAPSAGTVVSRYPYPYVGGTDGLAAGDINGDGIRDVVGSDMDLGLGWALGTNLADLVNLVVGEGLSPGAAAFNIKNASTSATIAAPSVEIRYSVNRGEIALTDWPQECSRPNPKVLRIVCKYPDLGVAQSASGIVHYAVLQSQPYMQLHAKAKATTTTEETVLGDNTFNAATWIRTL